MPSSTGKFPNVVRDSITAIVTINIKDVIMNNEQINDIEEADNEYVIISKNISDILGEMDFEDEEEKILCESIITNLEKSAAASIREMKTVSLPYIGCLRINPIKRRFRDAKLHLSLMRKNMSKEDYKNYVRDTYRQFALEQKKIDEEKLIMTRIKRCNKKKYEELYKKLGRNYANMFIYSIRLLAPIDFDAEWEEQYQRLKGKTI